MPGSFGVPASVNGHGGRTGYGEPGRWNFQLGTGSATGLVPPVNAAHADPEWSSDSMGVTTGRVLSADSHPGPGVLCAPGRGPRRSLGSSWARQSRAVWHSGIVSSEGQPKPLDQVVISILRSRDSLPTEVWVEGGQTYVVYNIAWGYDIGDEYSHVTTNVSPPVEGRTIDFFLTNEIEEVIDPTTREVLWHRPHTMVAHRVDQLLQGLCLDLGFCLGPDDWARLCEQPPDDVDEFVDAIYVAEGVDPLETGSTLRAQVRDRVERAFRGR